MTSERLASSTTRPKGATSQSVTVRNTSRPASQDWGDVSETRDHPGSRTRRTGEDLIEWTPIQQYQLKYVPLHDQQVLLHTCDN